MKIGKVFAVDLTSLVVVGITIVLMGLTRKTKKKPLTTRMFNLNAWKINCVNYNLIQAHTNNMQISYSNVLFYKYLIKHEFIITLSYIQMLDHTAPLYNHIETDNSFRSLENYKVHHK